MRIFGRNDGHGFTPMPAQEGLQQLNRENEAARFDEALTGYFRIPQSAPRRARGGRVPLVTETDTSSTPETCLKQLKCLLRDAAAPAQAQYIQRLYATVLHQLKRGKRIPVVFSRVVGLCRELFKRSVAFRALITTQTASFFDKLLLTAGEDPSANVSRKLRAKSRGSEQLTMVLALIETWTQDFGDRYPSLVAGQAVLMERGYVFPHERERMQEEKEREVDTRRLRERVSKAKKKQRDKEMAQLVPEMEQVLVEMNRVFEILVPTLDAFQVAEGGEEDELTFLSDTNAATEEEKCDDAVGNSAEDDIVASGEVHEGDSDDVQWEDVAEPSAGVIEAGEDEENDVEWENVVADSDNTVQDNAQGEEDGEEDTIDDHMDINDIVQAYGLGSSSYHLTIEVSKQVCEESADNEALFRNLADGALRIRKRFLPLLDDWEQYSTLAGTTPFNPSALQAQREVLTRIRDLRDRMARALMKWDDLVQGAKESKRDVSTRPAVVSLPLDAYDPPAKRRRQSRTDS